MIRTSFSTLGCPDWTWHDVLRFGPEYGYNGVEVRLIARQTDLLALPEFQPSQLPLREAELENASFEVCGLSSSVRFDDPDDSARNEQVEVGRRHLDLANGLGAGFIRVFGDRLPPGVTGAEKYDALRRIAEPLQRLGEFAEEAGVTIAIETHGDFADTALMSELLSFVPSPAVAVLWDTHHPWRFFGEPLGASYANLQPRIAHTHWKDSVTRPKQLRTADQQAAEASAHALMSGHRPADYVLFGGGEFPVLEAIRVLKSAGYDDWCSLEWEKMWHPEIDDPEIALRLFPDKMRSLWNAVSLADGPRFV